MKFFLFIRREFEIKSKIIDIKNNKKEDKCRFLVFDNFIIFKFTDNFFYILLYRSKHLISLFISFKSSYNKPIFGKN